MAQHHMSRLRTVDGLGRAIMVAFLRGAPCGTLTYELGDIRTASVHDGEAWAAAELDPSDLHIVVVGDAAVVRDAIRDAGLKLDE